MRKPLIAVLPLLLLVCGAQTPPTATEVFNLRVRCRHMADEKADALAGSFAKRPAKRDNAGFERLLGLQAGLCSRIERFNQHNLLNGHNLLSSLF
jgi:hypothetical protein